MASLRIKRGTEAERLTITPLEGELIYTTDTLKIYVGDGSTVGGVLIVGQSGFSGSAGTNGLSGYSGLDGVSGYSGVPGLSGYSGEIGSSGFSGYSGVGGMSDQLVNGMFSVLLDAVGNVELPKYATISGNSSVTCPAATSTVIYTSTAQYQHTIKLLVEVEGVEGNDAGAEPGDWDTQSCEIMVAKSFRNDNVVASVYGVTYTSLAAIATFTADWNVGLNRVEVKCTPVSTLNNVYVRVSALGLKTSD